MPNLNDTISRLAHLPPSPNPVISCFVNTLPMGNGRPTRQSSVRNPSIANLK